MRFINKPALISEEVYDLCLSGVIDANLNARLNAIRTNFNQSCDDYDAKAAAKDLHLIPPNNLHDASIVAGAVTKHDLIELYSYYMVNKNKPARNIYDIVRGCSINGRCPFCGDGLTFSVDHFLPKARFPLLSVAPSNLVPSCRDCNFEKKHSYALTAGNQTLHPYFDHGHFVTDRWIHATIQTANPVTLTYFAMPPNNWDEISKQRAESHFNGYELGARFETLSTDQLTIVRDTLIQNYNTAPPSQIKTYLKGEAIKCQRINMNSWQTALHWALAENEWYCGGGFRT